MIFLFSDEIHFADREVFYHPKGFWISDTEWTKLVNQIQIFEMNLRWIDNCFDVDHYFWKIRVSVFFSKFFRDKNPKCVVFFRFDGESGSLSVSTISDEKMLTLIEEFDEIAPFW